jgi:hypothetical protein
MYVREDFIRDQAHWDRMLGYFNRRGYFEGESYQSRLPAWALRSTERIKRYETMKGKRGGARMSGEESSVGGACQSMGEFSPGNRAERTNEEIILSCGSRSAVSVKYFGDDSGHRVFGENSWQRYEVSVDYSAIKKTRPWVYENYWGLTLEMSVDEFREWSGQVRSMEAGRLASASGGPDGSTGDDGERVGDDFPLQAKGEPCETDRP